MRSVSKYYALLLCFLLFCGTAYAQFDRQWKVFLIPFSHTDVGYTDSVPVVVEKQNTYLDSVIAYVQRTKDNAPGEQFKWTVEISWPLESYLQTRGQQRIDSLFNLVREKRVDIGAFHFGLQTDMCANEELVRSLYYSCMLAKKYNFAVKTGLINDTPGFTWGLAQVMPQSGVKYLATALNAFLCDFFKTTSLPYLFYWKAQSGDRTLVWRNIDKQWAYLEGSITQQVFASYGNMKSKITALLQQLQTEGYPYDAVFINCATGDNGAPNLAILNNAHQWNSEFTDAKVRIATATEFFEYMESKYQAQIPEYSGDAPNWWTWLFGPSAAGGAAVSREAQVKLPVAETFSTFADAVDPQYVYDKDKIERGYINNLLFEDHNLGAVNSSGNQDFWNYKMNWINSARAAGEEITNSALSSIAGKIGTDQLSVAVFNPLLWHRSETVIIDCKNPAVSQLGNFVLKDKNSGALIQPQFLSDTSIAFNAADVPCLGYKVYELVKTAGPVPQPGSLTSNQMENDFYRIALSTMYGDAQSVYDKQQQKQISKVNDQFNRYMYNGNQYPQNIEIVSSDSGAVLQRIRLKASATGSASYRSEIVLHSADKRIDFYNTFDKLAPTQTETVDYKFAFAFNSPSLKYEIPFGAVNLFTNELSGFRTKHYSIGRWMEVNSSSDNISAVIASRNASVGAYPSNSFDGTVRMLISYTSPANAYRAGIGPLSMDFSLTSASGITADPEASRFAQQFNKPMLYKIIPANQAGSLPAAYSLMSLMTGKIELVTMKKADDNRGFIIRLYNPSANATESRVKFSDMIQFANQTSLVETDGPAIASGDSGLALQFNPYEIKTIRVCFQTLAVNSSAAAVYGYNLMQNYPNPFNPETVIRYEIGNNKDHAAGPKRVTLRIYDALGRNVVTLVDREQAPGRYDIRWNASGISSGVYFYELCTNGFRSTKKLLLLK